MSGTRGRTKVAERNDEFPANSMVAHRAGWSTTIAAPSPRVSKFEAMLLAIAGGDVCQPLKDIQSALELFSLGVRTSSELRWLRSGQSAIDRLNEQLRQIQTALHIQRHATRPELRPVQVHQVLRQARREHEHAALSKGISMRVVPSDASILSDDLLLGAAVRNLVSNAIKYTQPGGRILIGCRHFRATIRIDVFDTGAGIPDKQIPLIFEAFTRLEPDRCEGLGVGLFIVRQALGILGHRIDVISTPRRGSRFSILVARAGAEGT